MKMPNKKFWILFYSLTAGGFLTLLVLMQTSVIGLNSADIGGRSMFDAKLFYYDREYFYTVAALMDGTLMSKYYLFHLCDYLFVFCYYSLMVGLTRLALKKEYRSLAFVIPALTALADVAENLSADILLSFYPAQYAYADFVGVLSCIKWYSGAVWALVALALGAYKFIKYLSYRRAAQAQPIAETHTEL